MKDIAAATGVSVATVSNAFNHPDRLSAARRDEIFSVAHSLGYSGPHPGASSLRTGSVGAIGLMITDWLSYAVEDPASTLLLQGIAHASQMSGTVLSLIPFGGAINDRRHADQDSERALTILKRSVVDGFIAFNLPDSHPAIQAVLDRGAPLITVDAPRLDNVGWVGIDERAAATAAAQHLVDLGHRRIGVVVDRLSPDGTFGMVSTTRLGRARDLVARERLRGYAEALASVGMSLANLTVVEAGGYSLEHARRAARILWGAATDLTAVLATSDVMAFGVLDSLAERAVVVPEAVSVVGFDDIPAAAARGLTTIRQPLMEKGRWAAEMLMSAINGAAAGALSLPWELQTRSSSTALR
jgi:DNA-binding LacI/PurR family transcriptional regulator